MKKILFILLICPWICSKLSFGQSFNAENIISDTTWITGQKAVIPDWVFEKPAAGTFVAVSDPCLSEDAGKSQALLRAWFLALMSESVKVQIVAENFEITKLGQFIDAASFNFNQFVRFAPEKQSIALKITKHWTSIFGETFIEVTEVNKTADYDLYFSSSSSTPITGEFVTQGKEGVMFKTLVRSELFLKGANSDGELDNYYLLFGTVGNYKLVRWLNNCEIDNHERGRFWYYDTSNADEDNDEVQELEIKETKLIDGLWSPLYESMVSEIVNYTDYPYTVKTIFESYDNDVRQIIRSSYSGYIKVEYNGFKIKDNHIIADWKITLK